MKVTNVYQKKKTNLARPLLNDGLLTITISILFKVPSELIWPLEQGRGAYSFLPTTLIMLFSQEPDTAFQDRSSFSFLARPCLSLLIVI